MGGEHLMYAPARTETTSTGGGSERTVDLRERRSGLIPLLTGLGCGAAMMGLVWWIIG